MVQSVTDWQAGNKTSGVQPVSDYLKTAPKTSTVQSVSDWSSQPKVQAQIAQDQANADSSFGGMLKNTLSSLGENAVGLLRAPLQPIITSAVRFGQAVGVPISRALGASDEQIAKNLNQNTEVNTGLLGKMNVAPQKSFEQGGTAQIASDALQSASNIVGGEGFGSELASGLVQNPILKKAVSGMVGGGEYGLLSGASTGLAQDKPTLKSVAGESLRQGLLGVGLGGVLGTGVGVIDNRLAPKLDLSTKPDVSSETPPPPPPSTPVLAQENQIKTPPPKPTLAEYSKSQGYEPYTPPEKLPVIQMGAKAKSTLPTIDIGEGATPKVKGDLTYEPIKSQPLLSKENQTTPETMAGQATKEIKLSGGSTLNIVGDSPKSGYTYSPSKATETKIPESQYTDQHYIDFANQHSKELANESNYVGIYRDGDNLVLDISRNTDNLREALDGAKNSQQDSIYDVNNKDLIFNHEYETAYSTNKSPRENPSANRTGNTENPQKAVSQPSTETASPQKVSKVASDINKSLVAKGIGELPPEQLSKFGEGSYKDTATKVASMMDKNIEEVKSMARGDTPIPSDIKYPQILFNAVKNLADKEGDIQLLKDLANSPHGAVRSEAAGTLGSSGFNNEPEGTVSKLQEIKRSLVSEAGGETKVNNVRNRVLSDSNKVMLPKEELSWENFLSKIPLC